MKKTVLRAKLREAEELQNNVAKLNEETLEAVKEADKIIAKAEKKTTKKKVK